MAWHREACGSNQDQSLWSMQLIISQNIKQQKYCFYITLLGKHSV
jgi:hypothetical protein